MNRVFSFVFRHPQSGILYFRCAIPTRLQPTLKRREIRRSLRTTNKTVAIPSAMRLYASLQEQFQQIDGDRMKEKKERISEVEFYKNSAASEPTRPTNGPTIELITVPMPGPNGQVNNIEIDYNGDVEKEVAAAEKIIGSMAHIRANAPWGDNPVKQQAEPLADTIKLVDCAKKYCAEKLREGSWTNKTASEHEALHDLVVRILGNKCVDAYSHKDGRRLKEILLQLPANMTKGEFAGKTIKQVVSMQPKPMATRTVNEKLQRVSSLFDWAIRQGYCSMNPFQGLKLSVKRKASDEREAFTSTDLQSIFNPDHFSLDRLRDDWKRWLPFLALYTGCRAQEICQLRVMDVFEENNVYALQISPDAGKLKNLSAERVVPVHRELIDKGFLDFVRRQKEDGQELLFPDLHRQKIKASDKLGKWFNRTYLTQVGLKPTNRKISFHSFRHTFLTRLKHLDVTESKAAAIAGHSHGGITFNRYGKDYNLAVLAEVVERLDFDLSFAVPGRQL